MKTLIKFSLLIATSALVACNPSALKTETVTGNEAGFLVNSHLIIGQKEVLLIDAQFTRSQASKVVKAIQATGKELKQVFVTHGHPDHYFGLETIAKAFPQAKFIALPEVVKEIQATAQGKLDYWKKMYGAELPDSLVLPEAYASSSLKIEGNELPIIQLDKGESESASVVYIPSLNTVVTGDLIYNQVHLWLAEDRPEGWMGNLKVLRSIGTISKVLPGHGVPGDSRLIDMNVKYITDYLEVTASQKDKKAAIEKMKALYPTYSLPIILELSVGSRLK